MTNEIVKKRQKNKSDARKKVNLMWRCYEKDRCKDGRKVWGAKGDDWKIQWNQIICPVLWITKSNGKKDMSIVW